MPTVGDRCEVGPPEMKPGVQGFAVDRSVGKSSIAKRAPDRDAVHAARVDSCEIEQRRRDVDLAERARDPRARAGGAGKPQDPRNAQRLAIKEDAVFGFAVVALMIWLPGGLLSIPEKLRLKVPAR